MRPVLTIVATLKRASARLPTVTQQVRRRWAAPQIPARVAGHQQKKTFDRETGIRNEPATGYQRQKPSSTPQDATRTSGRKTSLPAKRSYERELNDTRAGKQIR